MRLAVIRQLTEKDRMMARSTRGLYKRGGCHRHLVVRILGSSQGSDRGGHCTAPPMKLLALVISRHAIFSSLDTISTAGFEHYRKFIRSLLDQHDRQCTAVVGNFCLDTIPRIGSTRDSCLTSEFQFEASLRSGFTSRTSSESGAILRFIRSPWMSWTIIEDTGEGRALALPRLIVRWPH